MLKRVCSIEISDYKFNLADVVGVDPASIPPFIQAFQASMLKTLDQGRDLGDVAGKFGL